ncbi:MAG: hypothetical protein ACRD0U_07690 [Acidimicrobiales bacterium]
MLAACNGGDGDDDAAGSTTTESSTTTTTRPTTTTSTTQPPANDVAAVEPYIVDLLNQNDEVVATLRQEPSRANDGDDQNVERYLSLYTSDSPQARAYLETLRGFAVTGTAARPGPSGILEATQLVEILPEPPDPDTVFFSFCGYTDFETVVVATGEVQARQAIRTIGGGEARRVEGVWKLHDFQVPDENLVSEYPPGTANPCELEN